MKRVLIATDIHYCHFDYGGMHRDEKVKFLVKQIKEEYEREPFECILMLGDFSLDHWKWQVQGSWLKEGRSYTAEFIEGYCKELPAPCYMIAGNHEQYGEEKWRELTGGAREHTVVVGDTLFILWDSYGADLDPDFHSDGTYTPPKTEEIRAIMEAHPDKKVILCSHYFKPNGTEEEKALIRDERVVCLVMGHTHSSKVLTLPEDYGSKKILQAGAWIDMHADLGEVWGVRDIKLYDDRMTSDYIAPEADFFDKGEALKLHAHKRDSAEILY